MESYNYIHVADWLPDKDHLHIAEQKSGMSWVMIWKVYLLWKLLRDTW